MSRLIDVNYVTEAGEQYDAGGKKKTSTAFADKLMEKAAVSRKNMSLEEYKKYFNTKIDNLYTNPSQKNMNWIIEITDAAYERMKNDPAYEQKVLDAIAKNKACYFGGCVPQIAYIHIDDTWEKCYGYTGGMRDEGRTGKSSENTKDVEKEKKKRRKKLLEEYLEKRARDKRILEKLWDEKMEERKIEGSCLIQAGSRKRQIQQSYSADKANALIETMNFCSSRCRKH